MAGKRGETGSDLRASAGSLAASGARAALRAAASLLQARPPAALMREAGETVRELRELAGLTLGELADAMALEDRGLLKAVEEGTATLSFELILRLSAILARNDPVPFVVKMTRTYNPAVWEVLQSWGVGRLPLQYEREREFVNVLRSQDAARKLSDEGFAKVLRFTEGAFQMALHFVEEEERARGGAPKRPRAPVAKQPAKKKTAPRKKAPRSADRD